MARRSARLSNRNSSTTPKRVSLSHDEIQTPRTLPAKLSVLHETDEMPGAFPNNAAPEATSKPTRNSATATPSKTTPIKPASQDMHPQHHQQSTAKPLDEARYLGFSNMGAYTAPPRHTSNIATLQLTPTKSTGLQEEKRSSSFQFTFRREHSLELSPQAKKLMNEKREEAAKIRLQMVADGQGPEAVDALIERKIAIPKSQKGRFAQAHQTQFDRMDSIAGHASAFRAHPGRLMAGNTTPSSKSKPLAISPNPKSLKRSPSKAGLDEPEPSPSRPTPRFAQKTIASSSTPQSSRPLRRQGSGFDDTELRSVTKRVKISESADVSGGSRLHSTPAARKSAKGPAPESVSTNPTTPTQASSARKLMVKSAQTSRIPGPSFTMLKPSGATDTRKAKRPADPESPLLSRSPAKMPLFTKAKDVDAPIPSTDNSLLSRSPLKSGVSRKPDVHKQDDAEAGAKVTPLLSRSPSKPALLKKPDPGVLGVDKPSAPVMPLFARSPVRNVLGKRDMTDETTAKATITPLFARSPSKFHMQVSSDESHATNDSGIDGKLMTPGRPRLLQVSPIKSILRSPQRLFSDDPAKLAAGTHFSTPTLERNTPDLFPAPNGPNTAQKRVGFTASTKAGEGSSSPVRPLGTLRDSPASNDRRKVVRAASASIVEYPTLPTDDMPPSPSPQKRRLTCGPLDFTFRAGEQDIVFGPSPNAPRMADLKKSPSTIRYVPSEATVAPTPATGSKKRKFDFENTEAAAHAEPMAESSDKENTPAAAAADEEGDRPKKRSRVITSVVVKPRSTITTKKATTRMPTLGVKPKKDVNQVPPKRTNAITQSRLNALAQPKRRN